jgi:light-regulated signal transduction histidine kinase (bacteriophytochrome)
MPVKYKFISREKLNIIPKAAQGLNSSNAFTFKDQITNTKNKSTAYFKYFKYLCSFSIFKRFILNTLLENKNITLEQTITIKKEIKGNPFLAEEIFFNLIDNAIKYTDKGFVKVEIVEIQSKVKFIVTDSGKGIPKKSIKHKCSCFS